LIKFSDSGNFKNNKNEKILAVSRFVIILEKNQIHDESQKLPQKIIFPQWIDETHAAKKLSKKDSTHFKIKVTVTLSSGNKVCSSRA
jgi:hypothetical protein